jgi:chromate reductase
MLAYLDMPTLGQPEVFLQHKTGFFAEDGTIASDGTRQYVQKYLDRFAQWVAEHSDRIANR